MFSANSFLKYCNRGKQAEWGNWYFRGYKGQRHGCAVNSVMRRKISVGVVGVTSDLVQSRSTLNTFCKKKLVLCRSYRFRFWCNERFGRCVGWRTIIQKHSLTVGGSVSTSKFLTAINFVFCTQTQSDRTYAQLELKSSWSITTTISRMSIMQMMWCFLLHIQQVYTM